MLLTASWHVPSDGQAFRNAITAFLILGVIAEAGFIKVGTSSTTTSVAFLAHLAAVTLFTPAWVMFIAGATMLVADTAIRKKPTIRVLHNAGKEIIAIGLAAHAYAAWGGQPSLSEFTPNALGFLSAIVIYFTLNNTGTAVALALSSGTKFVDSWRQLVGGWIAYDWVAGPFALLLSALYIKLNLVGVLLVVAPLFFVRHVYNMNMRLERVNGELLQLMVKAIEARDPYTSGHSLRVSKLARAMAQELGLPSKRVAETATAALLHDVGKIYEEFAPLLRKEGKLLPDERELMQTHPVRSAELVSTISTMRGDVELAVRHHHESFNGSGYPDGLIGDEIPIGSRIIAIADTVDAMTTDRPYRKALSYDRVTQELQEFRGKQFDPVLVDAFCSSPRIQSVVSTHLRPGDTPKPKTVEDTFRGLREALGHIPGSMGSGATSRWQRVRPPADPKVPPPTQRQPPTTPPASEARA
jgi:putative nucleotidyltransferase with HDIG domain